jgi:hypothetical protein
MVDGLDLVGVPPATRVHVAGGEAAAFFGDRVTRAQVMAIGVMSAGVAAVVAG